MIKLSKRLADIASLVPIDSSVIDVGCDHALLDIYLYEHNLVRKIIASDINAGALDNAKENITKYKLTDYIETRLGNGLDTLKDDDGIDTIVISGMGAHTIVGIMKNNLKKLKNINTIIVQSNTKLFFLRSELTKLNYKIDEELILEDNQKVYTIIRFVKGHKYYSKKELYFGPILLEKKSATFTKYHKQELEKLNIFLHLIPKKKILERYKIKKEIKLYRGVIN